MVQVTFIDTAHHMLQCIGTFGEGIRLVDAVLNFETRLRARGFV